jgi:hypothetical protein
MSVGSHIEQKQSSLCGRGRILVGVAGVTSVTIVDRLQRNQRMSNLPGGARPSERVVETFSDAYREDARYSDVIRVDALCAFVKAHKPLYVGIVQ